MTIVENANSTATADHIQQTQESIRLLRIELARLNTLADQQKPLSIRLQLAVANAITSPCASTQEAVRITQQQLEELIASASSIPLIRQQILDLESTLEHLEGRKRSEHCNALKQDFQDEFDDYRQNCKNLLEQFRRLQQKSATYMALSRSAYPLLDGTQLSLNLPPLNSDGCFIATGKQ